MKHTSQWGEGRVGAGVHFSPSDQPPSKVSSPASLTVLPNFQLIIVPFTTRVFEYGISPLRSPHISILSLGTCRPILICPLSYSSQFHRSGTGAGSKEPLTQIS